jgi:DNA-binding NarL/FixJ family response regulator
LDTSQRQRESAQEERILTLVAKGQTNGQIGKELKLAEKTVKNSAVCVRTRVGEKRLHGA